MKNNAVSAAASYFLTITLARHFGPIWFGEYSYILIWGMIAGVFINFETDKTAPAFFAIEKNHSAVLESVLSTRILFFFVIFVIFLIGAFFNFILAFGVICISLAALNFSFLYEIKHKNITYSYIYIIERLTYVTIVFSLIYTDKANLFLIYLTFSACSLLSIGFQIFQNRVSFRTIKLHIKSAWSVIKNNILLILVTFSTYAYGGFSRLILEEKFDMETLGIFSAGWQVIIIITLFQAQVTRVWRIRISTALIEKNKIELYKYIKSYLLFATLPVISIAYVVYLFTPEVIELLYGSSYSVLNGVLPILCIYFIVINFDSLSVILWVGIGRKRDYLIISIVAAISLVIGLYFLPNQFGLKWFTVLIVATHALSVIIQLTWLHLKCLSIRFPKKPATK